MSVRPRAQARAWCGYLNAVPGSKKRTHLRKRWRALVTEDEVEDALRGPTRAEGRVAGALTYIRGRRVRPPTGSRGVPRRAHELSTAAGP